MEDLDYYDLLEEDQHDPEIQYRLGLCYLYGTGVTADPQEAMRWLQRAAEQGHGRAMEIVGHESDAPILEQINEDNLPQWCVNAEEGDMDAQYAVADYFIRHNSEQYRSDIERYLTMAAEQGHGHACLLMGQRVLASDPEAAVRYLSNATENGIVEAMWRLAACFYAGLGTEQSVSQAEYWHQKAAEQGDGEQKLALAIRYLHGIGVPQSAGKAMSWVYQASQQGIADARERLTQGQLDETMQAWDAQVQQESSRIDAEYDYDFDDAEHDYPSEETTVAGKETAAEAPYRTVFDMNLTKQVQAQAKKRATYWAAFGFLLFLAEFFMLSSKPVVWYILTLFDAFAYMPIATKLLEGFGYPRLLQLRLKISRFTISALALLHVFQGTVFSGILMAGYYFVSPYICYIINSKMEDLSTIEGMERFYNKHKGK